MWTATLACAAATFVAVQTRLGVRPALACGALVVAFRIDPILALAGTLAWAAARRWSIPAAPSSGGVQSLTGALLVGTAAGLSLQTSLERARSSLSAEHAVELEEVLRAARRFGLAAALARVDGSLAPLLGRLARAQVSGAPLASTISAFAAEDRELRRATRLEAARKLPVRLTVPLALLVLPGFVLLTAGPAAIGSLQRMLGPLLP